MAARRYCAPNAAMACCCHSPLFLRADKPRPPASLPDTAACLHPLLLQEARGLWASRRRYDALVRRALEDLRSSPPAQHTLLHHLMSLTDPDTGERVAACGAQLGCV